MQMMTPRERFERAIQRLEVDRLPFWVKIFGASYLDFQPAEYRNMGELKLAEYLDLDHYAGAPPPVQCRNDRVRVRTEKRNGRRVTLTETPDGTLRAVNAYDQGSHSWHPMEFPVKTREDLLALRHVYEGNRYDVSPELQEKAKNRLKQVGDRGIVTVGIGTSPLMTLIQHLIGPAETYYFFADYADEMDDVIETMHQDNLRRTKAVAEHSPCRYLVSVENTSTTLLSPAVFEKYPWRHLNEYGQIVTSHGKTHLVHMCGTLKDLLPRIDELPAAAIEAYTSPPVGNTTLADRARLCPNTAVIGGTDATLWLRPVDEICARIARDLDAAGGMQGVVLTSAGVMPPGASIEKIKKVRDFARQFTWDRFDDRTPA